MASSIAAITMPRSIDFSRATASAICSSSSLLALTAAMGSVSFGGVDLASAQSFCGKAMFLGVLRGVLLVRLYFRLRLVALGRVAFFGMRRRWWLEPEVLLELALRRFAAPHRFGDQLVGQDQSGVRNIFHYQHDSGIFAGADVIATQVHGFALDGSKGAAKPLAALMRDRHFDLHEMAGIAFEIGTAYQRPVDP